MNKPMLHATLSLVAALSLCGCLPDGSDTAAKPGATETVQVQATPGQLVEELIRMSADPSAPENFPKRHILTQQLSEMGPTTLAPLIDFMGAPDTDPKARLFILQCVADYSSNAYMPNLKPLLESQDPGTRATGILALAHIEDPTVVQLLTLARTDTSEHVSFAALSGMAMQGDLAAREELRRMYTSGTTMGKINLEDTQREVVRVLLRSTTEDDIVVLLDALNQPFLATNARFMIAEVLGRLGDKSVIPLLEKSLNLQTEPEYGEMVKQAVAAINEREGHA